MDGVVSVDRSVPELAELFLCLWRELDALYGPNPGTEFDPRELEPSAETFIAYEAGRAVGCLVLTPFETEGLEIKRMFVRPEARRRGHAMALIEAAISRARDLSQPHLRLETGRRQPAAIALYERAGFVVVPPWPPHHDDPLSICFELALNP